MNPPGSTGCSTLAALNCENLIRRRVQSRVTYSQISLEMQQLYPGVRGLSSRSIRRFCSERRIHYSSQLSSAQVEELVEQSVAQVCSFHNRVVLWDLLLMSDSGYYLL